MYCSVGSVVQCNVINSTLMLCFVLYCTVLFRTFLYCTILYCSILYTVVYCTAYYSVLWCTVLYSTVLYCTLPASSTMNEFLTRCLLERSWWGYNSPLQTEFEIILNLKCLTPPPKIKTLFEFLSLKTFWKACISKVLL